MDREFQLRILLELFLMEWVKGDVLSGREAHGYPAIIAAKKSFEDENESFCIGLISSACIPKTGV